MGARDAEQVRPDPMTENKPVKMKTALSIEAGAKEIVEIVPPLRGPTMKFDVCVEDTEGVTVHASSQS